MVSQTYISKGELFHFLSPGMTASLRAGKIVTLPTVGLFADGAAVKTVGKETFNICHQLVDEMITVQTGEMLWGCCEGVSLQFISSLFGVCL